MQAFGHEFYLFLIIFSIPLLIFIFQVILFFYEWYTEPQWASGTAVRKAWEQSKMIGEFKFWIAMAVCALPFVYFALAGGGTFLFLALYHGITELFPIALFLQSGLFLFVTGIVTMLIIYQGVKTEEQLDTLEGKTLLFSLFSGTAWGVLHMFLFGLIDLSYWSIDLVIYIALGFIGIITFFGGIPTRSIIINRRKKTINRLRGEVTQTVKRKPELRVRPSHVVPVSDRRTKMYGNHELLQIPGVGLRDVEDLVFWGNQSLKDLAELTDEHVEFFARYAFFPLSRKELWDWREAALELVQRGSLPSNQARQPLPPHLRKNTMATRRAGWYPARLTDILGISSARAKALREHGISCVYHLPLYEPEILANYSKTRYGVQEANRWRRDAKIMGLQAINAGNQLFLLGLHEKKIQVLHDQLSVTSLQGFLEAPDEALQSKLRMPSIELQQLKNLTHQLREYYQKIVELDKLKIS